MQKCIFMWLSERKSRYSCYLRTNHYHVLACWNLDIETTMHLFLGGLEYIVGLLLLIFTTEYPSLIHMKFWHLDRGIGYVQVLFVNGHLPHSPWLFKGDERGSTITSDRSLSTCGWVALWFVETEVCTSLRNMSIITDPRTVLLSAKDTSHFTASNVFL